MLHKKYGDAEETDNDDDKGSLTVLPINSDWVSGRSN